MFFDVFSVLHTCDEDKMREMAPIFESLRRIQREAGSAVAIVHHFNKLKEGSITQKLRGTSGFGGFAEWILAVELVDVEKKYRRVGFGKVKAGPEDKPVTYKIVEGDGVVRMEVVHLDQVPSEPPTNKTRAAGTVNPVHACKCHAWSCRSGNNAAPRAQLGDDRSR